MSNNNLNAWGKVEQGQSESLTKITQGPNESFTDFLQRLTTDLIRAISDATARELSVKSLAFENANAE